MLSGHHKEIDDYLLKEGLGQLLTKYLAEASMQHADRSIKMLIANSITLQAANGGDIYGMNVILPTTKNKLYSVGKLR